MHIVDLEAGIQLSGNICSPTTDPTSPPDCPVAGIELDSIHGSIIEIEADVAWQPFRHIGFGAGFRYFNTNVKAGNSELNGEFDFEYLGPVLYVHATF